MPQEEIGKTVIVWMPETLESQPNGGARSTCDPPIRVSFEPLLSMGLGTMTERYLTAYRSLYSIDTRSCSLKAFGLKNSCSPGHLSSVVISLGYCIVCNDRDIKLPGVATASIDWVTGPPIRSAGFRCRRTELSESQLQNDHVL